MIPNLEPVQVPLATRRATKNLARILAQGLRGGDLVILDGPLGAGKTFFVRALCRALGLPPREPVTSPTFTLIVEHETVPPVAHADLYRLDQARGVRALGLDAMRDDGKLVLVEWGAPYLDVLGGDGLFVQLALDPRRATLRGTGPRSQALVANLPPVHP